jgi:hypothetical protein
MARTRAFSPSVPSTPPTCVSPTSRWKNQMTSEQQAMVITAAATPAIRAVRRGEVRDHGQAGTTGLPTAMSVRTMTAGTSQ